MSTVMTSEEMLASILKALEGKTVLEAPRVSRETIVSTLKEHTKLIQEIKSDLSKITDRMAIVSQEAAENRISIASLKEITNKHDRDIDILSKISDDFKKQMNIINERVDDLPFIKTQFKEQKVFLEDLAMKFHVHVSELTDFVSKTNKSITHVDNKCNETLFQIKEIQDYVDHFEDSLILPSSQIRVETSAGFSEIPLSLLEILSQCNHTFEELHKFTNEANETLVQHTDEISKKAPEAILFSVNTLEKKVGNIEAILEKEEEQGLGAVRRQVEQLTSDVESITTELQDKVDKDSVNIIVHEKYDDIVKYLQDALQSSQEDEQNFKLKADELQELLLKLANSKCDRTEIAPMQEMLVKTEAMLKKINLLSKNDNKMIDSYTKKEIEILINTKVDKETFDNQINNLLKLNKKNKRLSNLLMTGESNVIDQAVVNPAYSNVNNNRYSNSPSNVNSNANNNLNSHNNNNMNVNMNNYLQGLVNNSNLTPQQIQQLIYQQQINQSQANQSPSNNYSNNLSNNHSSNLTNHLTNNLTNLSNSNISISPSNNYNNQFSNYQLAQMNDPSHHQFKGMTDSIKDDNDGLSNKSSNSLLSNVNNNNNNNMYISNSLPALPNYLTPQQLLMMSNSTSNLPNGLPNINNLVFTDGSGNILSFNPDDMNYERMVLGKGGSGRSTTITLPTDQRPGSFRIASEAGKPGGKATSPKNPFLETILDNKHDNFSQSNITLTPIPLHQQDLQLPSPKGISMNQGQDMSFLGAPTVGSGYNLKSGQMVKTKPMKSSSGFADNTQDLEAGYLVKGQDGKFYYTDEEPMSDSPVASVPTSKKINLKPKLQ